MGMLNCFDNRYELFSELEGYRREDLGNALYIPQKEILIIKCQEVFTKEGDILVLGLPKNCQINYRIRKTKLEDALKQAKDYNGIVISCHPFFVQGPGNYFEKHPKLLELVDAVGVYNGNSWMFIPRFLNANKKAQEFYENAQKDYDIGAISSSDGHSIAEVGSSYTILDQPCFKNSETLVSSLRKSIRAHKDSSEDKKHRSIIKSTDHAIRVAVGVTLKLKELGIDI
jgi:hypothetical protein